MEKIEKFEPELDRRLSDKRLHQYAEIVEGVIEKIHLPGAFTDSGDVSLDASGKAVDIWSEQSVQSDVLGWLLKVAVVKLEDSSPQRMPSITATIHIGNRARALTGRSIIEINDTDGREAVISVLKETADSFREEIENRGNLNRTQGARSRLYRRVGM